MIKPWKKIKEEVVYKGFRQMIRKTFELPNGKIADYDIIADGGTVCVLALTHDNNILIVRQFRPGVEKVLPELPGGYLASGLDPMETMKHELLEETGYDGDLKLIGSNVDAGYSQNIRYNFVATNCKKVADPKPEENEFLETELVSVEEFKKILESGENTDVETGYIGLHYLGLL